ncbi:hypothetical protein [Streptomyces sp. NPDC001970]
MAEQRSDINSLTDAELDDYIHSINVLRQQSSVNPGDPTGYDVQAELHNGAAGPCEHGSDLFLLWHRAHPALLRKAAAGGRPTPHPVLGGSPTPVADHVLTLQFVPAPSDTGLPPQPVAPLDEVELKDVLMEVYS